MKQLIQLHLGLIKYLKTELKKKRTPKELIDFLKRIIKIYVTQLLQLYKNVFLIFNKEYQQQKKQYNKYNDLKKDLQNALKLLNYIDNKMEKAGLNRQRRRQFWRDFYNNGEVRKDLFEELMKEVS